MYQQRRDEVWCCCVIEDKRFDESMLIHFVSFCMVFLSLVSNFQQTQIICIELSYLSTLQS